MWIAQYLRLESLVFGPVCQQELWCVYSHFGTFASGCLVCSCLHVCAGKAEVPESLPACQLETDFGTKHKNYPCFWAGCAHVAPGSQPHPPETWLKRLPGGGKGRWRQVWGGAESAPCCVGLPVGSFTSLPVGWEPRGCWGCPHLPARGRRAQPARPAGRPLIDALGRELPSCPRRKQEGRGDSARLSFSVPAS